MNPQFRSSLLVVLIFLGSYAADAQQFRVPGNTNRWVETGIHVENGTLIRIRASGRVNVGVRGEFGPEGTTAFPGDRRLSFPTDIQPLYGLALRFTSSPTNPDDELREDYAPPSTGEICSSSTGHLWLIVNDDVRADNTGAFVVDITTGSCTARDTRVRETRIHVANELNADIKDAEVFINGQHRGITDISGNLRLPPLNAGDRIIARSRVHESRTYRSNHQTGSLQNWNYRVYLTTAAIQNDGTPADFVVSNPDDTQELRLNSGNALIGLHIVASIEWDASRIELDNMRDQILVPMSQFLYNATDGQFFVEQIELADNATFWGDTDFRIHANLELRPYVSLRRGGFLHSGLATWMNMRRGPTLMTDSWFSAITAAHEFGHYGFDLGDEYADGDNSVLCTANLTLGGRFAGNQPQASCMMFSQFVAGKLCSNRSENPHRTGTRQGDENCWLHLSNQYRDSTRRFSRWFIKTPDSREAIPGGLPALLPEWRPRVTIDNRSRSNLCGPITLVVVNAETREPMNNVDVWVRTSSGQNIFQGKSGGYESGGGPVSFGDGNIPITGVHVGDRVTADGGEYVVTNADCSTTARLDEKPIERGTAGGSFILKASSSAFSSPQANDNSSPQKNLRLVVAPAPFALTASVEPTRNGLQIRVKTDAPLKAAPQVLVTQRGSVETQKVSMKFDDASKSYVGIITKLPEVAQPDLEVSASVDGTSFVRRVFSAVVSPLNPNDETEVFSTDGQLAASIPKKALPANTKICVSPSSVPPPSLDSGYVLVSGGYNIAASMGEQMQHEGVIRFQLPNRKGTRAADGFDVKTFEILRYSRQNQKWESMGGTFLPSVDVISVRTNQLGDYAVIARTGFGDAQRDTEKKSPAKFAVTGAELKAENLENSGKCPVLVKFDGSITVNGAGTVQYTFGRSDGATAPVYTLDFTEAGTKAVSTTWTLGGVGLTSYKGWQTLKILSPNRFETDSDRGRFVMKCEP